MTCRKCGELYFEAYENPAQQSISSERLSKGWKRAVFWLNSQRNFVLPGDEADTTLLLNFDRGGGTDFEDSTNRELLANTNKVFTPVGGAQIAASAFGDAKSSAYFLHSGPSGICDLLWSSY